MTAQEIRELAEKHDWEVRTDEFGELSIDTGVRDPEWDREEARQMRAWEAKDREEKRNMRR